MQLNLHGLSLESGVSLHRLYITNRQANLLNKIKHVQPYYIDKIFGLTNRLVSKMGIKKMNRVRKKMLMVPNSSVS